MPKETFINLSEEKQKKIFDAAVDEFSTKRFSEASINQIIGSAEIPRGSFYQYFENKEDLYLYVLTEIGKEKIEIAKHCKGLKPDADFFETFLYMMDQIILWANERPKYYEIGALMDWDDSDFIMSLKKRIPDGFQFLRNQLEKDQERGLIKKDVDPAMVVEMVYALNLSLAKEFYITRSTDDHIKKMEGYLEIIKGGVLNV